MAEGFADKFTLTYDGGLAASGRMYFYEFSRAAYGASRMITTIENFRRTGVVAGRVSSKNYVPLIINAPEKGSFPLEIIIPTIAHTAQVIKEYNIPVGDFIKYIINLLKRPAPKDENLVLELAKIELVKEEHRLAQSGQETQRLIEIRRMIESGNANTAAAIDVLKQSISSPDRRIAATGATSSSMSRILEDYQEQQARQAALEPYNEKLQAIGEKKLLKLVTKVRPQLAEVGLPLRNENSAASLQLQLNESSFATFDEDAIKELQGKTLDQMDTRTEIRLFAYDKDSGFGKCDLAELGLYRVPFSIPVDIRSRLKPFILSAMNQDAIPGVVRAFRNKSRVITSVLIYSLEAHPLN